MPPGEKKKFPLTASSQSGKMSGRRLLLTQLEKCAVTVSTSLCDSSADGKKGKRARKAFKMASRHQLQNPGLVTSAEVSDRCEGDLVGGLYGTTGKFWK